MDISIQSTVRPAVQSKITEAAVFFQGAELVQTARASLIKGSSEITIEGFSALTDRQNIKIKTTNGVIVSSFEFSVNYLAEHSLSAQAQKLKDEIKIQRKKLETIETNIQINGEMLSLLRQSIEKKTTGPKNGPDIDELMKAMDFFKSKSSDLEEALRSDREKAQEIRDKIQELSAQLNQETVMNTKAVGILKLSLSSPADNDCDFTIICRINDAGWYPYHDIFAGNSDQPIQITSKAKVRQLSGVDWDKVKLTLSTAVPSGGRVAPLFNAWFLNYAVSAPRISESGMRQMKQTLAGQNSYSYAEKMAVCESHEIIADEIADYESFGSAGPIYVIDGRIVNADYLSQINPSSIKEQVYLDPGQAVGHFGNSASGGAYVITLNRMEDYVSQSENQLNITYEIDLPYSIPGNGKEQSIELKNTEVPADFIHYCAPKLDSETYLIAEAAGKENLNLLSGNANITYDGMFIGETYIDSESVHEKLSLTLGTDRRVAVKREKLKEYSSKGLFGNDVKQEFAYQLTVRNNQNRKIKMVLKDQYPISANKEITVELSKESTPFSFNKEDLGVVTWEFEMLPGESKVFKLAYSVKYPKGKELNL